MFHFFKKSILLSILTLFFTSCATKTDGKYHTKYSYHPYYALYAKKMSNTTPKKVKVSSKKKKEQSKVSLNNNNRFPK